MRLSLLGVVALSLTTAACKQDEVPARSSAVAPPPAAPLLPPAPPVSATPSGAQEVELQVGQLHRLTTPQLARFQILEPGVVEADGATGPALVARAPGRTAVRVFSHQGTEELLLVTVRAAGDAGSEDPASR